MAVSSVSSNNYANAPVTKPKTNSSTSGSGTSTNTSGSGSNTTSGSGSNTNNNMNSPVTKPSTSGSGSNTSGSGSGSTSSGSGSNTNNNLNGPVKPNSSGSGSGTSSGSGSNTSGSGSGSTSSGSGTGTSGSGTTSGTTNKTDNPSHNTTTEKDNSSLDKDAFLKLFLEQLKAQDPTAPMETNQILEQSAMMTQIEQQQSMKETLEKMTTSIEKMSESSTKLTEMQTKMSEVLTSLSENIGTNTEISSFIAQLGAYNSSGVLGKVAETQYSAIAITSDMSGKKQTFDIYFDEEINLDPKNGGNENAKVIIKDKDNAIVKEILLKDYKDANGKPVDLNGKKGYISFEWDAKDKSGIAVKEGAYTITADYNFESDGKTAKTTKIGRGEVTGVAYDKGIPMLKLGTSTSTTHNYFNMLGATHFYNKA